MINKSYNPKLWMNLRKLSRTNLLKAFANDYNYSMKVNLMPHYKKITLALLLAFASLTSTNALAAAAKPLDSSNPELVYKYLVGEIAGQNGDYLLASQLFLDLAKQTHDARLAERAARSAAYANQPGLALQAATLWAEYEPNSLEAQQAASQLLVASGNLKQAKPHIAKLLAKEETRANGFLYLNNLLANQTDKNETLAAVQEFAAPYSKLPEAHFAIAQAAANANKNDVALTELTTADSLKPGWELSAQARGQLLYKQSPDKAIDYYRQFLNKYPNANDVRMSYAKMLVSQKRNAEAKPEFVKLVDSAKGSPEITAVVGLLSLETNDYPEADKYFQQSIAGGFKDPEQLYGYLGRSSERQKNDSKALEWYDKIQNGEHYLDGRISAASVIARSKNADAAIKMLDEVNDLTPEQQIIVLQTEAGLLNNAKRDNESFTLLGNAIKTFPNSVELSYDYAMTAERQLKFDVMEAELRKIIKLKPEFAAAYNALGYSFADRNIKLPEAQTLIETALKLQPNDHYMIDSLGWVHYRLGNLDKAADLLRKAYEIQNDPEIAAHLGEVLWKKGQQDEAKKIWANALKEHPENEVLLTVTKKFKS
jgi:tetratricopeptide (TPR) repeat protein